MMSKQQKLVRVAGLCGLLVPIVTFIFISLAIYYSPWFSWSENWLSELAGDVGETPIWAARGMPSILFNIGTIIAGIFGLVCAIGVRKIKLLDTRRGHLGTSLLVIDMLALITIGVFPMTTDIFHTIAAVIFFVLVPLSLIPIGNESVAPKVDLKFSKLV